ncbi:MAG: hypothetical protein HDS79_04105 [Bacteroidales bacterium]|nr:hypothetical protein [Bacteroidales bacterium]
MINKLLLTLLVVFSSVSSSYAIFDKYSINREDLPEISRIFLDEHFPKAKVSMVKTDKHLLKKTDYDVKLTNGTKIDFNNKGEWTAVDCGKKAVPETIIHSRITAYVSKNHSECKIVSIAKKNLGYNVGLSDGKILRFNALYQFKGTLTDESLSDDTNSSD